MATKRAINKVVAYQRAKEICDYLYDYTTFFNAVTRARTCPSRFYDLFDSRSLKSSINCANGASRFVFWDLDYCDYVIKIQFCDFDYDYGANEVAVYKLAQERGCADCFAWIDFAFVYAGARIYVAEFCDIDDESNEDACTDYYFKQWCASYNYQPNAETWDDFANSDDYDVDYFCDQEGMLHYAGSIWGGVNERRVADIFTDTNMNDVHCGNYGWIDGDLVITDYAGYHHALHIPA